MDADIIKEGVYFDKLKNTYIIFICIFDPFELGLPQYTVHQTFKEDRDYIYDDGTTKVYFNATAYGKYENEQIRKFMEYCATAVPNSNLTNKIHNDVEFLKSDEAWRKDVMTWQLKEMIIRQEEYDKGKLEGKLERDSEIVKKLLCKKFSIEEITELTGVSKEDILEIKKKNK